METYSKITRFCLICNYVTRIIDPLASRCSKFRFKSLDEGNARRRVEEIAEREGVRLQEGTADCLIRCAEGDLRKAITFLQSAARLVGAVGREEEDAMDVDGEETEGKVVTVKSVEDIAGVIPDKTIDGLVKAMQPSSKGLVYENVAKVVTDMVADGWSATQVVTQVCFLCRVFDDISDFYSFTKVSSMMNKSQTFRRTRSPSSSRNQTNVLWMAPTNI